LGDHTGLATVNATLKQINLSSSVPLEVAQRNALQALEAAFENKPDKAMLEACVHELEGFQGSEREHIAQLLSDVRKSLAKVRTTGLQGLLNKLKLS
jgi:alkylhydroperoxidase family enzyme